jgi:hypothetical protein
VTKRVGEQRCEWCGGRFVQTPGRGRPRRFCRAGCRQQAHLARKLATGHRLADGEVVVRREDLESIQQAVYAVQAAREDVINDLDDSDDPADVRATLDHLMAETTPLAELWITPVATAPEPDDPDAGGDL